MRRRSAHDTHSGGFRLLAFAVLLLQFGVPGVVSAMEVVRLDDLPPVDHVESEGSEHCALHHDHHFCQVVRTLGQGQYTAPALPADAPEAIRPSLLLPVTHSRAPLSPRLRGVHTPRGPPSA
jgi:hypothetical protein